MRILVTGIAGFIGMHVAQSLALRGHDVTGVDSFNDYYDPALKRARAQHIAGACRIEEIDIADTAAVKGVFAAARPDVVLHLAAQAGVRYSLVNPMAYVQANLVGHVSILEACREMGDDLSHLVYASSSSVYGGNETVPFSEGDDTESPVSLYAATKKSGEILSSSYAHLYGIRQVGLRFFTVYGAWGRPDMAYWIFTEKILKGEPIQIFNHGKMSRDFTYVDDIVRGVVATVETPPRFTDGERPHRVYNLGNNQPVALLRMIEILEAATGREAIKQFMPMQSGDVAQTYADIERINRDYGFRPEVSLEEGLPRFVDWYRQYVGGDGGTSRPPVTTDPVPCSS